MCPTLLGTSGNESLEHEHMELFFNDCPPREAFSDLLSSVVSEDILPLTPVTFGTVILSNVNLVGNDNKRHVTGLL